MEAVLYYFTHTGNKSTNVVLIDHILTQTNTNGAPTESWAEQIKKRKNHFQKKSAI